MGSTASRRIAAVVTAIATALVIVAISILPFLSPPWVSFEQGRAQADLWTGFTPAELNAATGSILSDLVFGPPNFDVRVDGRPALNEREQSHMRDVRGVFAGFWLVVLIAAGALVLARVRSRGAAWFWRSAATGATTLGVAVVALGAHGAAIRRGPRGPARASQAAMSGR